MTKTDRLSSISPTHYPSTRKPQSQKVSGDNNFADTLTQAQGVKFSHHAKNRLQKRQIQLSDDGLSRLADAVDKVERKGGRESLVLMDGLAFIVNVQDRMVVTALDSNNRGEGVFTQIDSVVLADQD